MKKDDIILIGVGVAAVAGAAYYFLVYLPGQINSSSASQTISDSISSAQKSANSNLTLSDLLKYQWIRPDRSIGSQYITGYNPANGIVSGSGQYSTWVGTLLDPQTIIWSSRSGQTEQWNGFPAVSASSSPTASKYPSKKQLLAALQAMPDLGGDLTNYTNSVNANYNQQTGHFQFGDWGVDIQSNEPVVLRSTKGNQVGYHYSSFYVSQHPELAGLRGLLT